MKLKTRLIIAFFVILFVPFLMFGIAFFGFSKYQMQAIEQSYGVPMSWDTLSDTMQVIGKSTEKVFKELKSQAEKDPDRFLDEAYLEKMNLEMGELPAYLLVRKDNELYYNGSGDKALCRASRISGIQQFFRRRVLYRQGCQGVCKTAGCRIFRRKRG